MIKISDIKFNIEDKDYLLGIAKTLKCSKKDILSFSVLKKSLDCRRGVYFVMTFAVKINNEEKYLKNPKASKYEPTEYVFPYKNLSEEKVVIVGSGPAGLFCGLMLARAGIKPTIIEKGQCVEERLKSVNDFKQKGILNINSNIQFGEGGAGTFSDGKLTCGLNNIKIPFVIKEFIKHGAPEEIGYSSKPHIGTDYLYKTVKSIREEIISLGGKVLFDTSLTDIITENSRVTKIAVRDKEESYELDCKYLILATGHSARDIYRVLYEKGANLIKKPFSVGVRIEHKREYINKLQYKTKACDTLPSADYKLSCHINERGAYTFCMCPGGEVVPSASGYEQVVTNGMSYFARDKENSNAALLVSVLPEDIKDENPLSMLEFQEELEKRAYIKGGENYFAPVQLVGDFLTGRESTNCKSVKPSYLPGVTYTKIDDIFPDFVTSTLKKALLELDKKMKGFCLDDAVLTAVESRSSAPVRIVRDENFESNIKGLFPIGEGAGYAGGIMSSAVDGINCAEQILSKI